MEPYLYNARSRGRYDEDGHRHSGRPRHTYGSQSYLLYGLVENVTVGVIPRFSYNDVTGAADSSGVGIGDFTVQGTFRLLQFREGTRTPTLSVVLQETLPTGKYDRLGTRPSDGIGSGAHNTSLALNSQYFLWMPNGRILRTRLNLSYAISDTATVEDISVYGTSEGFRGRAHPGRTFILDSGWEYSMTRRWALALDVVYQHDTSTTLSGIYPAAPGNEPTRVKNDFGSSELLTLAPAIEYNWSSSMGVIGGAIVSAAGRNTGASIIPVVAINMVF
ncbi:MAG: transporter [Gammaproteobacteria bacterium]